MTPDQIRISVAEEVGWKRRENLDYLCFDINTRKDVKRLLWSKGDGYCCDESDLPNYPSDLNACHEMEKSLSPEQKDQYKHTLMNLIHPEHQTCVEYASTDLDVAFATALQRCEAFLRVGGKWKD